MHLSAVSRLSIILVTAITAVAQQASSPAEMKSPAAPTSQQRPSPATDPAPSSASAAPAKQDSIAPAKQDAITPASATDNNTVPTTTIFPQGPDKSFVDPALAPLTLPNGKLALIGGVVKDIDPIRDRMTVDIFGKGGKMKMLFDPRTRVDRNGTPSNQLAIKKGDRVYVDSQLINRKIFARNIYVRSDIGSADAAGQIAFYNSKKGEITMHDQMSQDLVTFNVAPTTVIKNRGIAGSIADLQPDALVEVRLTPIAGKRSVANEIDVLAQNGSEFKFFGTLTHLDLRSGTFAVNNKSDQKVYDIRFLSSEVPVTDDWKVGAEVSVNAYFNGKDYTARTVSVTSSPRVTNPE